MTCSTYRAMQVRAAAKATRGQPNLVIVIRNICIHVPKEAQTSIDMTVKRAESRLRFPQSLSRKTDQFFCPVYSYMINPSRAKPSGTNRWSPLKSLKPENGSLERIIY